MTPLRVFGFAEPRVVRDYADTSPAKLGRCMNYPAAIRSDAFSAIMLVAA